jgi:hypothetical protein
VAFDESDRTPVRCNERLSIGFTFRGLQMLGVQDRYLKELRTGPLRSVKGAVRAALHLGDAGRNAVERWESMFAGSSSCCCPSTVQTWPRSTRQNRLRDGAMRVRALTTGKM